MTLTGRFMICDIRARARHHFIRKSSPSAIIATCGKFQTEKKISMSASEAAMQVLTEAGEPLHAEEITKRTLESRLWATSNGKAPGATMEAHSRNNRTRGWGYV